MAKAKIYFIIPVIFAVFISCANKDLFKDPGRSSSGAPVYKVNNEAIILPAFMNLPSVNPNIDLNFEKPAAKPLRVALQYTVDGWRSSGGKILSDGKKSFGLVLDFSSGSVYEMPANDLSGVLSKFTADNATVINAVVPDKEGGSTVKMALIDANGNFNKQELKYLRPINLSAIDSMPGVALPEEKPLIASGGSSSPTVLDPKNSVVPGKAVISAASGGQYDRLLRILNRGGNLNEINDKTGDNALISSIRYGNENIADLLINKGIDVNHINFAGQNALHAAANIGYYDISKKLIDKGVNVNSRDKEGNTPLLYAAASPNSNLVNLLADNGARLEDRNKKGETPLAVAALVGNTRTVRNLVKRGADAKTKDDEGNNLVMKAVVGGNKLTAGELMDYGVSGDEANNFGVRPVHVAVKAGYGDIAGELLKRGANVNAQDPDGNTPLILASSSGNASLVNGILKYKPEVMLANKDGQNAYDVASARGFEGIRRALADSVQNSDTVTRLLFDRAAAGDEGGVEQALERGARINSMDTATGNNVLFTAVANNYPGLAALLIKKGAEVNHLNDKGNTPLIVAVTSADKRMVDILIKSGAYVNARNNAGDTALIWATKLKRPDMVRALLMAGADPNIKNSDGVSAYTVAEGEGMQELVNILQAAGGHK